MNQRIPIDEKLTQRVRKHRLKAGLSQEWLAQAARVPRARIKRIECNELQTLDVKEYKRICKTLGIAEMYKVVPSSKRSPSLRKKTSGKHPATRRAVLRLLEEAGVLDMTLRELIS